MDWDQQIRSCAALNNDDRAIAHYNPAIQLDPKYALAYTNRCNAHNDKGYHDHAIADCAGPTPVLLVAPRDVTWQTGYLPRPGTTAIN